MFLVKKHTVILDNNFGRISSYQLLYFRDASDYESDTEDDAKLAKASQNKK